MKKIYTPVGLFLSATILCMAPGRAIAQGYEQQLRTVCASLRARLVSQGKTTAAVVDFTDLSGNVTPLGRFLAEELSGCLVAETTDLQVVERLRLNTVLREQKLAESPIIDPATAKKLGEIVGAQAIITGTLTPLGDSVRLSVRALDVGTARVIGAASADIPKTRAIDDLLTSGPGRAPEGKERESTAVGAQQASANSTPDPPAASQAQQQTVRGITWRMMDCQKSVRGVTCRVMVTHSQNGELTIQLQRATTLDNHNNDATAYFGIGGNFLRLSPGANEVVRFAFESGTAGRGGRTSSTNRLGEDATELTSIQLDFAVVGTRDRLFVRFQRVPIQ